jgi:hypothetical protein
MYLFFTSISYNKITRKCLRFQTKQLATVVGALRSVSNKKSYILPVSTRTLADLIRHVSADDLCETIWPLLEGDIAKGWEDCTPDRLVLLLALHSKDKVREGGGDGRRLELFLYGKSASVLRRAVLDSCADGRHWLCDKSSLLTGVSLYVE